MNKTLFVDGSSRFNFYLMASLTVVVWAFGLLVAAFLVPLTLALFIVPSLPMISLFGALAFGSLMLAHTLWPSLDKRPWAKETANILSLAIGFIVALYGWMNGWYDFWAPVSEASLRALNWWLTSLQPYAGSAARSVVQTSDQFLKWWLLGIQPYAESVARAMAWVGHHLHDEMEVVSAYLGLD